MQAIRQIRRTDSGEMVLRIPTDLLHRTLEVIVIPLENETAKRSAWPSGYFERTAGSFAETPIVREEQGTFEQRDEIL